MVGFGLAPVIPQGKAVDYVSHNQGWSKRYVHVVYGLGIIVTEQEMDDGKYPVVSRQRSEAMAFSMRQTKENVHANIINRAVTDLYFGGDGVVLASASHPTRSGNQSNILAPAADISEDALEDMDIQVMDTRDDLGLRIGVMSKSVHVAKQNWYEANRILGSVLQNYTANNALNVLKSTNAFPEGIKMNHYFTDTNMIGIKTNVRNGLMSFQRKALRGPRSDNDFDTDNAKFKCDERYSAGWTDWRGWVHSVGA